MTLGYFETPAVYKNDVSLYMAYPAGGEDGHSLRSTELGCLSTSKLYLTL